MKRFLFGLIFICSFLMLTAPVSGAVKAMETAPSEEPPARVRILDKYTASPDDGELILFFSQAEIGAEHKGDIYAFFSEVNLQGDIEGTVYTFSAVVNHPEGTSPLLEPIIGLLSFVGNTTAENGIVTYSDVIPGYVLFLFWIVAETLICMMLYPIKPGFMEQGAVLLFKEPVNVLRNGMTMYFFCLALAFIFGLTVFLLPVSVGVLAAMQAAMWVGEVALAIMVGRIAAQKLNRAYGNGYMVAVLIAIGLIKCIPYVTIPFVYVVLPVLTLGLVTTGFINGWVHRKYYETPFRDTHDKKAIDISAVRGILMKDV